jgi:hypothetical protein
MQVVKEVVKNELETFDEKTANSCTEKSRKLYSGETKNKYRELFFKI